MASPTERLANMLAVANGHVPGARKNIRAAQRDARGYVRDRADEYTTREHGMREAIRQRELQRLAATGAAPKDIPDIHGLWPMESPVGMSPTTFYTPAEKFLEAAGWLPMIKDTEKTLSSTPPPALILK